jgi:fermentation-respiration switch protein FrsA (DUF1100 family)
MAFGDRFFYHPTGETYDDPRSFGLAPEDVFFETSDGVRLHGWFFAADGPARGTVVHLHGNAGNVTGHFAHAAWVCEAGWNLLCFDYRGYGRSAGKVTRGGLVTDCHAAIDYAKGRPDVEAARIVVLGQSLGGSLAIVVGAQRKDLAGIAADGAFSHYRRVAWWHVRRNPVLLVVAWWVPLLMSEGYDPIACVARVAPTPLLLMHGRNDTIVPYEMAEELYAAANEPKELWLIDGVGHYEALSEHADVAQPRLLAFFDRCTNAESSR